MGRREIIHVTAEDSDYGFEPRGGGSIMRTRGGDYESPSRPETYFRQETHRVESNLSHLVGGSGGGAGGNGVKLIVCGTIAGAGLMYWQQIMGALSNLGAGLGQMVVFIGLPAAGFYLWRKSRS